MRHFKYCSPMRVTLGKGSFSFPQGLHSSFGSRGCCQKRTAKCNESMYSPAAPAAFSSYPGLSTFQTTICGTGPQPCAATPKLDGQVSPKGLTLFLKGLDWSKIRRCFNCFFLHHLGNEKNRAACECIIVYCNGLGMSCLWSLVTSSVH